MTPVTAPPEFDVEQEVDLRRAWGTVAARWWLPLAGLAVGIVAGYLLSLGGSQVYKAEATLYLGQPFSPTGNTPVQSLNTNPRTVSEIVRSESGLREAARRSGLRVGQLRGKVSSQAISGAAAGKTLGNPLVEISVQGSAPRKVELAANALASIVIGRVSTYVDTKIGSFQRQLNGINADLKSIDVRLAALNAALKRARSENLSPLDQLVLISQLDNAEQRRGQLLNSQTEAQQVLALAQNVEKARVISPAAATKTTARSTRNSVLVGALIGLILGVLAAFLWEPVATRLQRPRI